MSDLLPRGVQVLTARVQDVLKIAGKEQTVLEVVTKAVHEFILSSDFLTEVQGCTTYQIRHCRGADGSAVRRRAARHRKLHTAMKVQQNASSVNEPSVQFSQTGAGTGALALAVAVA